MAIGKNIKAHREARGWTLADLSERSGVELGTIGALEVRDSARSKFASAIAKALGMTVEELESGAAHRYQAAAHR
jgi:transcriptional regulator with XRE-family HTH domain